MTDVGPSQ